MGVLKRALIATQGHRGGDLIKGAASASAVGSLVERTSQLLMLIKLPEFKPAGAANLMQAFSDKLLGSQVPCAGT